MFPTTTGLPKHYRIFGLICRSADTKLKLKKARQALRAQSGRMAGPMNTPEENQKLQQSVRESIDKAKVVLQKHFAEVQTKSLAGGSKNGRVPHSKPIIRCMTFEYLRGSID